jgi:hypothetical protein
MLDRHERPCEINATGKRRALHAGRSLNSTHNQHVSNRRDGGENFLPQGSAQPLEKAEF